MSTVRVTPGAGTPTTINLGGGRIFTCAMGATLDVPDWAAAQLEANGWIATASDVTTNRPAPTKNALFCDTTLGLVIKADGKQWHNPVTGAVV